MKQKYIAPVLLLSTSFFFSTSILNANVFIKNYVALFVIGLLMLYYFIKRICNFSFIKWHISAIDLLVFAFTFFVFVNHNEYNISILAIFAFYISSRLYFSHNIVDLTKTLNLFYWLAPIAVLGHIVLSIFQQFSLLPSFHGYFSNGSTFGNPDMLASYMVILIPFVFVNPYKRIAYGVGVLSVFYLVVIQARTAIFALLVYGIVMALIHRKPNRKLIILGLLLFCLIATILIVWQPNSVFGRLLIWYVSFNMMLDKPLCGWGPYSFEKHYLEYQASFAQSHSYLVDIFPFDVVHSPFNEFFYIGVSYGIPILLLYFALNVSVVYFSYKFCRPLFPSVLIFVVVSCSYFPFKIFPLVILLVPLVAIISTSMSTFVYSIHKNTHRVFSFLIFFSGILISSYSLYNTFLDYSNFKKWQQAVYLMDHDESLYKSNQIFLELYPSLKKNGRFLITYAVLMSKQGKYQQSLSLLDEAENYFIDIQFLVKKSWILRKMGKYDKAESLLIIAESISPQRHYMTYERILLLIEMSRYKEAYELCIVLYDRAPSSTVYIDALIIRRNISAFIEQYEESGFINSRSEVNSSTSLYVK